MKKLLVITWFLVVINIVTVILFYQARMGAGLIREYIRLEVERRMTMWSPTVVYGKYVTVVDGAEVMVREDE